MNATFLVRKAIVESAEAGTTVVHAEPRSAQPVGTLSGDLESPREYVRAVGREIWRCTTRALRRDLSAPVAKMPPMRPNGKVEAIARYTKVGHP